MQHKDVQPTEKRFRVRDREWKRNMNEGEGERGLVFNYLSTHFFYYF